MIAIRPSRFAAFGIVAFALTAFSFAQNPAIRVNDLIVHEWGTFTSIAGQDGFALEWQPLSGASDLPSFVYTVDDLPDGLRSLGTSNDYVGKSGYRATVRMETPVLYFYSDHSRVVSVRVDFPDGKITEWYPSARSVGSSIDWGAFTIIPNHSPEYPREPGNSHYYPARETDSAPLRICNAAHNETVILFERQGDRLGYEVVGTQSDNTPHYEYEKFLFYRGAGTFDLPLRASLTRRGMQLSDLSENGLGTVIFFERQGDKVGYEVLETLEGEVKVARPALDDSVSDVTAALENILIAKGLYEKEAQAMINTWVDSWFEEGLRVFYILPRKVTDAVLPITISPTPAELVRVLVGRMEIITPAMTQDIADRVSQLRVPYSLETQDAAVASIKHHGRFAEPVLLTMLKETEDPDVRFAIQAMLDGREEPDGIQGPPAELKPTDPPNCEQHNLARVDATAPGPRP